MASVNISESDFSAVASAAVDAQLSGDHKNAEVLDKLARKMNATLAGSNAFVKAAAKGGGAKPEPVRWQDMPSVLLPEVLK